MPTAGLCFVFVCQAGDLEAKAMLLAASLRRFLSPEHELVAAIPAPQSHWGRPADATLAALERHSVRVTSVVNRVSLRYPIGNKIDCLAIPTDRAKTVLLDSDMLVLRAASLACLNDVSIGAVPASFAHARPEDWARSYGSCGLPAPPSSMRTLVSHERTPPYFNAGFVLVDRAHAAALADEWGACARRLLQVEDLAAPIRDRFLDQVALPIAAARLGIAITPLPLEWNFPSWSMSIGDKPVPAFFHYQHPSRLMREAVTERVLSDLLERDGGIAQALLAAVRAADDGLPLNADENAASAAAPPQTEAT